tara:strand:- start:2722 stop:3072 length:351 start_codon:yes stop_codon:yes gene_type:complete
MSHPSKLKGNRFEREIVDKAKDVGLDAKRAWGSNGMALGEHPEVDCIIDKSKIQAKVRKKLPAYLIPSEEVDAVVFKQDRGEILMLLRYEDWLFEQKRFDELKQIGFDVLTNKKDK